MIRLLVRVASYALSATVACIFYVNWIAVEVGDIPGPSSLSGRLLAASILCVFGGFSAALVLMALAWILVVWIFRWIPLPGAAYFSCAGASLMVLIGCAASSMSPKPLFIEDQTFLEGVLIAFERQGVCLALAGSIIGLGYWFLAERNVTGARHPRPTCV
jgi:hypothetical protein